jgi:hypothetical protein
MSFFPDMGRGSMVASGEHVRAIGWLHPDHPYTRGEVSADFVARLKEFAVRSSNSDALYFGVFAGLHTCEFCGQAHGTRNFGVPRGDVLFVAPEMVVHYVEQHGYCPPAEFVAAVLRSPLPDSEEYQVLTEPFWHLHNEFIRRVVQAAEQGAGEVGRQGLIGLAGKYRDDSTLREICEEAYRQRNSEQAP